MTFSQKVYHFCFKRRSEKFGGRFFRIFQKAQLREGVCQTPGKKTFHFKNLPKIKWLFVSSSWLYLSTIIFGYLKNKSPITVEGTWGEWSPWSGCSSTCGGGSQSRSRLCNSPSPSEGVADCPGEYSELLECNTESCKISTVFYLNIGTKLKVFSTLFSVSSPCNLSWATEDILFESSGISIWAWACHCRSTIWLYMYFKDPFV